MGVRKRGVYHSMGYAWYCTNAAITHCVDPFTIHLQIAYTYFVGILFQSKISLSFNRFITPNLEMQHHEMAFAVWKYISVHSYRN